jgi:sigma-B regulation protein RsbU (phosphoserine phosphatase)
LADPDPLGRSANARGDSIETLDPRGATTDSLELARARAFARRFGVRPERITNTRPQGSFVIREQSDTLAKVESREISLAGLAIVRGLAFDDGHWLPAQYPLTAHASLLATLTGLFENFRENPLRSIPVAVLLALGIALVPIFWTDMSMVRGMGGSITRGIRALREGAAAFGAGKLGHRIAIEGDDDLWDTARQFNQMAEGLERARELEKERDRLEAELDLARQIQARLLPSGPPHVPGLDVAGVSESAREVGGDYYDHIEVGDGRVLLVVADVSGKGVPAALLMSAFRASLMSQDVARTEPSTLAARLNEFLVRSVEPGRFVTAFVGFLDGRSGRFVYVNAGHNPPVVLRAAGGEQMLAEGGLILGIMAGSRFEAGETTLAPGDLVALYTDGVTEGADAAQEQWGEERLLASLRRTDGERASAIAARIVREVRAFEGESGPADDITVLIARRTSPG